MIKGKKILYITIFLLCVLLSSIIFMQFKTARQTSITDIQNMNEDELKKEIISMQNKYEQVYNKLEETNSKIQEYENASANGKKNSDILDKEQKESLLFAGLTNVEGEGISLILEDNEEEQITSSHLLDLINELKYAGAEAISINDNRITNYTDIVDVNYIIMIDGIKLSSPYKINVIGDQTYLTSTLNSVNGFIKTYKETGFTITMKEEKNIKIPKFAKDLKLRYGTAIY